MVAPRLLAVANLHNKSITSQQLHNPPTPGEKETIQTIVSTPPKKQSRELNVNSHTLKMRVQDQRKICGWLFEELDKIFKKHVEGQ